MNKWLVFTGALVFDQPTGAFKQKDKGGHWTHRGKHAIIQLFLCIDLLALFTKQSS